MYLESVVIDGFKSYAQRTVIDNWDSEFNAITGLNGSGKSNILDAICFGLGITQLKQLRATSLADLIYKKGQAGVQRASVTLTFNNTDTDNSPLEHRGKSHISVCRQIVVGGTNKYLINGSTAKKEAVENLFGSVSLNVNSPHFLIMQGKITSVLNMKPPEILAMIEEAAGSRMFEKKKREAQATIAKKDEQLKSIDRNLNVEIAPRLNTLKDKKRIFIHFQDVKSEREIISNFMVLNEYFGTMKKVKTSASSNKIKQDVLESLKQELQGNSKAIKLLEKQIALVLSERGEGQFGELESQVQEDAKEVVKSITRTENMAKNIADEEKAKRRIAESLLEAVAHTHLSAVNLESKKEDFGALRLDIEKRTLYIKNQEELLQTLKTGMASSEGHENGFMDQLNEAKKIASVCTSDIEQSKIKLKFLNKELKESQPKAKKAARDNESSVANLASLEHEVAELKDSFGSIIHDPELELSLQHAKVEQQKVVAGIQTRIDILDRELLSCKFNYTDPMPNFDRSKVKGMIAELVDIDNINVDKSVALEVCAGAKLYNVVVESEIVGSQLLENGNLKRRVTLIPLNKIRAVKASADKIATADKVAPGKTNLALSLVAFDDEVSAAMHFVFGNSLICKDAESANIVTFHRDIKMKSITLDGDIYDPRGSLSGGSKATGGGVLLKVRQRKSLQSCLIKESTILHEILGKLAECQKNSELYTKTRQSLELKVHQMKLLAQQMESNANAKVLNHVEELQRGIGEHEALIISNRQRYLEACEREKQLEEEIDQLTNNREGKLLSLQKDLDECKKSLHRDSPNFKIRQQEVDLLEEEIKQGNAEVKCIEGQVRDIDVVIAQLLLEEKKIKLSLVALSKKHGEAEALFMEEKKAMLAFDVRSREYTEELAIKKSEIKDYDLQIARLTKELHRFTEEKDGMIARIASLEKSHAWITDKVDSDYDFSEAVVDDKKERLANLEREFTTLRRDVEEDVMKVIEKYEEREHLLQERFTMINKDKKKIQATIEKLSKYQLELLEKTFKKVNVDFGDIFGDLLKGNTAKLVPLPGQDISEGLEVKVCIGGVWKESLSELSGGQKSLIALSLIMSLLQFKPAPMYILDEIDAALDLDHTQNIGQLFKNRFKGSQFIVVSLKEGMFTNANVLFKAKFKDGISAVERHVQKKISSSAVPAKAKKVKRVSLNGARRMSLLS